MHYSLLQAGHAISNKRVMRFAGPRMTFKHPVLTARHLIRKYCA